MSNLRAFNVTLNEVIFDSDFDSRKLSAFFNGCKHNNPIPSYLADDHQIINTGLYTVHQESESFLRVADSYGRQGTQ